VAEKFKIINTKIENLILIEAVEVDSVNQKVNEGHIILLNIQKCQSRSSGINQLRPTPGLPYQKQ